MSDEAFDRIKEKREKALKKIADRWDILNEKIDALTQATPKQEKVDLEKEYQAFMVTLKAEKDILKLRIAELNKYPKESSVIQERVEVLQEFLRSCNHIHEEADARSDILAASLGKAIKKDKPLKPATEIQQFEETRKEIDKFAGDYKKFSKANKNFTKSEYFGLKKSDMNIGDLEKLSSKLEDHTRLHGDYLNQMIRHAASQKGINIEAMQKDLYESQKAHDIVKVVAVNPTNKNLFPADTWDAIMKLNAIAISINNMNGHIQARKSIVEEENKKLNEVASKIKAAEKENLANLQHRRKELEAKIQEEQERSYVKYIENVGSFSENRLLYAPLTPVEAEKIRRKQAFLNELRVQQALANDLGLTYDVGENVAKLCKLGSLKATQFSAAAWEGAKEVMDELSSQALHSIDMTLAAPVAIPVKATNAAFTGLGRVFGYLGAWTFESPRDVFVDGLKNYGKLSGIEKFKFWGSALTSPVWFTVGGVFRGIGKISDAVQKGLNYDRMAKNSRGFTTAAGTVGGLTTIALVIAAPFTLGLSLIPLAAVGIGLAVSTAYSAKRAVTNAAKNDGIPFCKELL